MNIEWFDPNKGMPAVTIAMYGINLNSAAAEFIKKADKVKLGIDKKQRIICIQLCNKSDTNGIKFPNMDNTTKNARLSCKEFIQFVSITFGIDLVKSTKYYASWDETNKMLIIDLSKEITKGNMKRNQA